MYEELKPVNDEDVVFLTSEGNCIGAWMRDDEDLVRYGDQIMEFHSHLMKEEDHRDGVWIWRICQDWSMVCGYPAEEDDEL